MKGDQKMKTPYQWTDCTDQELQVLYLQANIDVNRAIYSDIPTETVFRIISETKGRNRLDGRTIDEDIVQAYSLEMAAGTAFPAIIVTKKSSGMEVISGYHRTSAAMKAGIPSVRALVIDASKLSPNDIRLLMMKFNDTHGKGTPRDILATQLACLIIENKLTIREAKRRFPGLSDSTLTDHIRREKTRRLYESHGIRLDGVTGKNLASLAGVKGASEAVRVKLAEAVAKIGTQQGTVSSIKNLCHEIEMIPNEDAQIERIQDFVANSRCSDLRRSTKRTTQKMLLLRYVRSLHNLLINVTSLDELTEEELDEFVKMWNPMFTKGTTLISTRGRHG